jgi:hypothetical protein
MISWPILFAVDIQSGFLIARRSLSFTSVNSLLQRKETFLNAKSIPDEYSDCVNILILCYLMQSGIAFVKSFHREQVGEYSVSWSSCGKMQRAESINIPCIQVCAFVVEQYLSAWQICFLCSGSDGIASDLSCRLISGIWVALKSNMTASKVSGSPRSAAKWTGTHRYTDGHLRW